MLTWHRYRMDPAQVPQFVEQAGQALQVLAQRPGYLAGELLRCTDDEGLVVMTTRWEGAGAYRRALSDAHVKQVVVPLMYRCEDEPGAFEAVVRVQDGRTAFTDPAMRPGWGSGGR